MALISIEKLEDRTDTRLALWHMSETIGELLDMSGLTSEEESRIFDKYKSETRRREKLTVRILLNSLFGTSAVISYNEDGRPFLSNGYDVSISHTRDYVAVIVSRCRRVAVDIEKISQRALKVKDKFLRPDEKATSSLMALIHWCSKETLYKFYSYEHLELQEMRVNLVEGTDQNGFVLAENLHHKKEVRVSYHVAGDFVLTYIHQ